MCCAAVWVCYLPVVRGADTSGVADFALGSVVGGCHARFGRRTHTRDLHPFGGELIQRCNKRRVEATSSRCKWRAWKLASGAARSRHLLPNMCDPAARAPHLLDSWTRHAAIATKAHTSFVRLVRFSCASRCSLAVNQFRFKRQDKFSAPRPQFPCSTCRRLATHSGRRQALECSLRAAGARPACCATTLDSQQSSMC